MENKRDRNIYLRSWNMPSTNMFSEHPTNLPSIPSMLASQLSFQLSTLSSLAQYSLFSNRKVATSSCKYLVDPQHYVRIQRKRFNDGDYGTFALMTCAICSISPHLEFRIILNCEMTYNCCHYKHIQSNSEITCKQSSLKYHMKYHMKQSIDSFSNRFF